MVKVKGHSTHPLTAELQRRHNSFIRLSEATTEQATRTKTRDTPTLLIHSDETIEIERAKHSETAAKS